MWRLKLPKLPRLTAKDVEKLLIDAGFVHVRTQGSHFIYLRGQTRVVVPYHSGKILHPKIIKQVLKAINEE
jgi:predicted RNA binding protein YcfA (HicA-like mRNA interferase family)